MDEGRGLEDRISRLAAERVAGASEVLDEVLAILGTCLRDGHPVLPVARALCHAQPSMAAVWSAALEAITADEDGDLPRFERFVARVGRSAAAVARSAAEFLLLGSSAGERAAGATSGTSLLRVLTVSASGTVLRTIEALRAVRDVEVLCSESRPALEGRRLAARLAASGVPVTCFADTAIAHALLAADVVVLGADAVSPDWFLNKSGSWMLSAAAMQHGVPVYVVATREKFVDADLALRLTIRDEAGDEVWASPPPGVTIQNRYFERTPLDLVSAVITDTGTFGPAMVRDVCAATGSRARAALLG